MKSKLTLMFAAAAAALAALAVAQAESAQAQSVLAQSAAASVGQAQDADAPKSAEAQATPAMWRVADADSEYILLGTFHILPPHLQWRTAALNKAFEDADIVYFEVEADTPNAQTQTLQVMMTQGFNPPGVTLSGMLEARDAQKLKEISSSLGIPFAAIDPMRPWQAFLTLTVQFIVKQGFDPGAGVDSKLLSEARSLGKDIRFFETLGEQLSFFTSLKPETEKSLLALTVRDWDNQAESFDALYNAWRVGDAEFIDSEMNRTMRDEAPAVFETLIVKRNQAWAQKIAQEMRAGSGTALIAVGAGHLVGDEYSVPALLAAQGFEVSRYKLEQGGAAPAAANDNAPPDNDEADALGDLMKSLQNQ